jgi:hypothetical protein
MNEGACIKVLLLDSYREVRTTHILYNDETVDYLLRIHINDRRHKYKPHKDLHFLMEAYFKIDQDTYTEK